MTPSTNHVERGLKRLLSQYRRPKIQAWLTAYLNRVQELEDALWEIINGRNLETAEGVQLDLLGTIVGRGRNGLSDTLYRLAIRTQIRINRSQGLSIDLTNVLTLSVSDDTPKAYDEYAIATSVATIGPGTYDLDSVRYNLRESKSLGTRLLLVVWEDPAFMFSEEYPGVQVGDETHAWGSVYEHTLGGYWSHVEEL